jgi:hypothetical protein
MYTCTRAYAQVLFCCRAFCYRAVNFIIGNTIYRRLTVGEEVQTRNTPVLSLT